MSLSTIEIKQIILSSYNILDIQNLCRSNKNLMKLCKIDKKIEKHINILKNIEKIKYLSIKKENIKEYLKLVKEIIKNFIYIKIIEYYNKVDTIGILINQNNEFIELINNNKDFDELLKFHIIILKELKLTTCCF